MASLLPGIPGHKEFISEFADDLSLVCRGSRSGHVRFHVEKLHGDNDQERKIIEISPQQIAELVTFLTSDEVKAKYGFGYLFPEEV
jgi:hypothetical protein